MTATSSQYGECMPEEALFELLSLECRVYSSGAMAFHNSDGHLHRVYGPAIERVDGSKFWYQNGQLHRLDGPAIDYANGSKFWYQDGLLHRLDGPAVEYPDGHRDWYIEGRALTKAEWLVWRLYDWLFD